MKKYEVTISLTLHDAFTIEAGSEEEAKYIAGRKLKDGEIGIDELSVIDDTRIDCAGEVKE